MFLVAKSEFCGEPSVLFQLTEKTQEKTIDINLKAYKNLDFGSLWGGLSYRRTLDGAEYVKNNSVATQKLQFFSPIVGLSNG